VTAEVTPEAVFRAYYDLPERDRWRLRWVMSERTLRNGSVALSRHHIPEDFDVRTSGHQLLARPIRLDDSAAGIQVELMDVSEAWDSRDAADAPPPVTKLANGMCIHALRPQPSLGPDVRCALCGDPLPSPGAIA
jgi:hypothetical protein